MSHLREALIDRWVERDPESAGALYNQQDYKTWNAVHSAHIGDSDATFEIRNKAKLTEIHELFEKRWALVDDAAPGAAGRYSQLAAEMFKLPGGKGAGERALRKAVHLAPLDFTANYELCNFVWNRKRNLSECDANVERYIE